MKKLPKLKPLGGGWKDIAASISILVDAVELLATAAKVDLSVLIKDKQMAVQEDSEELRANALRESRKKDTVEFIPERKLEFPSATDLGEVINPIPGGETESEYEEVVIKIKKNKEQVVIDENGEEAVVEKTEAPKRKKAK